MLRFLVESSPLIDDAYSFGGGWFSIVVVDENRPEFFFAGLEGADGFDVYLIDGVYF